MACTQSVLAFLTHSVYLRVMSEDRKSTRSALAVGAVLAILFAFASSMDYASELTDEAIRKDPPKILSYSIHQDSPGLDEGQPMFPLHSPVAYDKTRAEKHRRSTREQR
jgi:hypothetical protein